MARFFGGRFPYTNMNNLNLDWIIKQILTLTARVEELVVDIGNAYIKPLTGIPKTDLSASVQTSLDKADSALQSVPSTYRTAAAQDVIDSAQDALITPLYSKRTIVSADGVEYNARCVSPIIDIHPLTESDRVVFTGINICPIFYAEGRSSTSNGVTRTGQADGSFIANGTTTSSTVSVMSTIGLPAGTYYLSGSPDSGSLYLRVRRKSDLATLRSRNGDFYISEYTEVQVLLVFAAAGFVCDNIRFTPMITRGNGQPDTYVKSERIYIEDGEYNTHLGYNYFYAEHGVSVTVEDYISALSDRVYGRVPQASIAPVENGYRATQEFNIGDFLFHNGVLYKAITAIAPQDILTVDANIEETSIGAEIVAILNAQNT